MSSNSTCTYKDLIEDYRSTQDGNSWYPQYIIGSYVNEYFNQEKVVVCFTNEEKNDDIYCLPTIDMDSLDEMTAEPLLSITDNDAGKSLYGLHSDQTTMHVAISTYGLKCLMFILPDCLLCANLNTYKIYVPSRLHKMVFTDMKYKGVDCQPLKQDTKDTYFAVDIPYKLHQKAGYVYSVCKTKETTPNHKPMYGDGFPRYCPVNVSMLIELSRCSTVKDSDRPGDIVIERRRRQIRVVPINMGVRPVSRNRVAGSTNNNVRNSPTLSNWSPLEGRMWQ